MSKPDAFAASVALQHITAEAEQEEDIEDEEVEMEEEEEDGDDDEALEEEEEMKQSPLEAWRQVHSHLIRAVTVAREAVAAKKAQRRFWMEEICANLTEEGSLTNSSVWKRPVSPRKPLTAKKAATKSPVSAKKRKKKTAKTPDSLASENPPTKKARKTFFGGPSKGRSPPSSAGKTKKTLRLKLPTHKQRTAAEEAAAEATADIVETSEEECEEEDEAVVEVEAEEVDDDEEEDDEDRDETDEEGEDDDDGGEADGDGDGEEDADHYSHQQHYPPPEYHHGHWGGHPPAHPYMVRMSSTPFKEVHLPNTPSSLTSACILFSRPQHAVGYSPPSYPSYHQHPRSHPDQYSGFYAGAGSMQSGLSSEGFYSTYSGPQAEGEGVEGEEARQPAKAEAAAGSGSESDGGPTF